MDDDNRSDAIERGKDSAERWANTRGPVKLSVRDVEITVEDCGTYVIVKVLFNGALDRQMVLHRNGIVELLGVGGEGGDRNPDQRTLTLPNGTVVRAGDVFAHAEYELPWTVTAVGAGTVLILNCMGEELQIGTNFFDVFLRPWSEVYPDRPAPGDK
jgi:hypothetical protein